LDEEVLKKEVLERGTAVREPTHPLPRYERQILSDEDEFDEEARVNN
jgi:hypothetical protein